MKVAYLLTKNYIRSIQVTPRQYEYLTVLSMKNTYFRGPLDKFMSPEQIRVNQLESIPPKNIFGVSKSACYI